MPSSVPEGADRATLEVVFMAPKVVPASTVVVEEAPRPSRGPLTRLVKGGMTECLEVLKRYDQETTMSFPASVSQMPVYQVHSFCRHFEGFVRKLRMMVTFHGFLFEPEFHGVYME
ncbi:hypothetical protein GUJ93_ZPchr0013g35278 [Zizania palustris]|uniref:Uncharacterized protein n=1 Tax=Zizania palustris TaxID=103762 RepID=A0A8J6BY10_ZIZPA|nr:hypothetical protein GUJ93_ZPchr0013g35278 [Zizania palustris]